MQSNQTLKLVTGSTTSVALINENGEGRVISLQQVVNQLAQIEKNLTAQQALVTAITALGLTLPEAK